MLIGQKDFFKFSVLKVEKKKFLFVFCPKPFTSLMIMQEKVFLSQVIKFHSFKSLGNTKLLSLVPHFQFVLGVTHTTEGRA